MNELEAIYFIERLEELRPDDHEADDTCVYCRAIDAALEVLGTEMETSA